MPYAPLEGTPIDVDISDSDFGNLSVAQQEILGRVIERGGENDNEGHARYIFAAFGQDTDIAAGDAVVLQNIGWNSDGDINAFTVSGDTTGNNSGVAATGVGAAVAAHSPSTDAELKYGWVQIGGFVQGLKDDSNGIAQWDYIIADGANDRNFAAMAAGDEHEALGIAASAASGGTFDAILFSRF